MKITAKGMFKRLGYQKERILNERFISYKKPNGTSFCYIQFDLKEKTYNAHYFDSKGCHPQILSAKEILAIQKQIEELGWLDEKTCTNLSEFDSIDEFECSNCGIVLSEYQQIEIDEDDGERYFYDYRPKYCPNCGRKIIEENEDE